MLAAVSFLQTLLADAEHIVEADLPSASDVRKVVAALVKRVEQLAGIEATQAPEPPPEPEPQPQPETPPPTAPAVPATPVAEPAAAEQPAEPQWPSSEPA